MVNTGADPKFTRSGAIAGLLLRLGCCRQVEEAL